MRTMQKVILLVLLGLALQGYTTLPNAQVITPLYQLGWGKLKAAGETPDREYLIALGEIGIYAYDIETFEQVWPSGVVEAVEWIGGVDSFDWSPDDSTLALGRSDGKIYFWDARTYELAARVLDTSSYEAVLGLGLVWSPDGEFIVTRPIPSVMLWDVETGNLWRRFDKSPIGGWKVAFSPDGKLVATVGDFDPSVFVWDTEAGRIVSEMTVTREFASIWGLAFSPDGSLLAAGTNANTKFSWIYNTTTTVGEVTIWDVQSGEPIKVLSGLPRETATVEWSPNGDLIAASSWALGRGFSEADATFVWDVESGKRLHSFVGQYNVDFSPTEDLIASIKPSGEVVVQDALSGETVYSLIGRKDVFQVKWSSDGQMLAGRNYYSLSFWSVSSP